MITFLRACRNNRFNDVKGFLYGNDLVNVRDRLHGKNCLLWAIHHGDIEAVKYLMTFDQLDLKIADHRGQTALSIAMVPKPSLRTHTFNENGHIHDLYSPDDTIAMLETLSKVNKDLINRYTCDGASPLQYAVQFQSIEVVKILVKLGANVNHIDNKGQSILSTAASYLRLDILRYLLNETDCDPYAIGLSGYLPCTRFIIGLIDNAITSADHFEFGLDFISRSHKSQLAESFHVHRVLLYLHSVKDFEIDGPIVKVLFPLIVKFVVVGNPREHLVQKLLATELEETVCLISLLFLENFLHDLIDNAADQEDKRFDRERFEELKLSFLVELFPLFLKDEALANEYVAEIARIGYKFCYSGIVYKLFLSSINAPDNIMRSFAKMLLRNRFDILGTVEPETFSMSRMCQHIEFQDDDLSYLEENDCVNASVTSENWILDYYRLFAEGGDQSEVCSLQNLSRLTLRRYAFQNHSQQEAVTFLNSLNLPNLLKNFLTFN